MPIVFGRCVGRERRPAAAAAAEGCARVAKEGTAAPSPPAPARRRRFPFLICRRQSSLVGAGEPVPAAVAAASAGRIAASPARTNKPTSPTNRRCDLCRRFARSNRPSSSSSSPRPRGRTEEEEEEEGESGGVPPPRADEAPAPPVGPQAGGGGGEGPNAGKGKPSSRRAHKSKKVHRQESGSGAAVGGSAPSGTAAAGQPPAAASSSSAASTRHRHHQQQQNQEQRPEDAVAVAEAGGATRHASSSGSTSFATWVIKRMQSMRFFQPKRAELDPEELEMLQPARCRPERLEAIRRATRFSRKEIQFVYRAFKQECPSGMVTEDTFKAIYAKFFPQGDSSQYAHYVFNTLDRNKTGTITFTDIMLSLSILLKGSLHERIRWAFSLYDVNDDGYVTREELSEVITAIYDLIGDQQIHHHRGSNAVEGEAASVPETPNDHVDRMFKKLDLNHDGVITVDEFIDYCSTNDNIRSSFAVFDDLW